MMGTSPDSSKLTLATGIVGGLSTVLVFLKDVFIVLVTLGIQYQTVKARRAEDKARYLEIENEVIKKTAQLEIDSAKKTDVDVINDFLDKP